MTAAARWLLFNPRKWLVYASYSGGIAERRTRQIKELYELAGGLVRADERSGSYWRTAAGGGCIAAAPGTALTGMGGDLVVLDDIYRNREEAESLTIREGVWDWFTSTLTTRVEPGGSIIVISTRWHVDDLIGRLIADGWPFLNLTAIAEPGDVLGRQPGEALWPERWSTALLEERRRSVGEYDWWSLFMGRPRPRGGALFGDATTYDWPNLEEGRVVVVCDPAMTARSRADYTAIVVALGWRDPTTRLPCMDVLEVHRMQQEFPAVVDRLAQLQETWRVPVWVESVGGLKAAIQMVRRQRPGLKIHELQATADKFTRSLPSAAAWNDGRIRLPQQGAKWLPAFLAEMGAFTGSGDARDDQVDALAHAFAIVSTTASPGRRLFPRMAQNLPFG